MSVPCILEPSAAKVIPVIFVSAFRGDGTEGNPVRMISLYYSLDGELLACYDELNGPPDSFHTCQREAA